MLAQEKLQLLQQLTRGAGREELSWIHGYLNGLLDTGVTPAPATPPLGKVTIAFGTESGRSKLIAQDLAGRFRKFNVQPKLVGLDQYRLSNLVKEEYFFTIMSTQGEGEPPAAARKFYDYIHNSALDLSPIRYGVLALGDTSYPLFCKAGEDVDSQLLKLGANRLVPLAKCDVDYEETADAWIEQVLNRLTQAVPTAPSAASVKPKKKTKALATVLGNILLNDRGSNKQTHHIELAVDEELAYEPGDALSMIPRNSLQQVQEILALLNLEADSVIRYREQEYRLSDWLGEKVNISCLPQRTLEALASQTGLATPLEQPSLLDLLRSHPELRPDAGILAAVLEPMAPRLYSISSSPLYQPGELHLTVSRARYAKGDEERYGVCSDQLSCIKEADSFEFRIHQNLRFRLPEDDKDIIMIGPGTGIAPFRGFLQHREAKNAPGRNWLFFGEQHFITDFYYQTEIQSWLESGLLYRADLAFSRDQPRKVYVQNRLWEQAAAVFEWISKGAFLYLCGSEHPMSEDVEEVLKVIFCKEGKMSEREAERYLEELQQSGRYLKDVY